MATRTWAGEVSTGQGVGQRAQRTAERVASAEQRAAVAELGHGSVVPTAKEGRWAGSSRPILAADVGWTEHGARAAVLRCSAGAGHRAQATGLGAPVEAANAVHGWAMGQSAQAEPRAVAACWAARRGQQLGLGQRLQGQPGAGAQTRAATRRSQAGYRARMSREQAGGGGEGQTALQWAATQEAI